MIIEPTFLTHWKTQFLKQKLGEAAPLYVIALWSYCQTSHKAVLDIPHPAIAAICGFTGQDPEALINALVECRFVDRAGDRLTVHEWGDYNGKLLSNWENGRRGGRPSGHKGTQQEPPDNPPETQNGVGFPPKKPTGNPQGTHAEQDGNTPETQNVIGFPPQEPAHNPQGTEAETIGNPTETHAEPIRLDKSREDKTGEEPEPPTVPLTGDGAGSNRNGEKATAPETGSRKAEDEARRKAIAHRLNAIFSRHDTTRWSDREVRAMRRLWPISDEDMALVEAYYRAPIQNDRDYRRHDLLTLLNNWPGELDRARKVLAELPAHSASNPSTAAYLGKSWSDAARKAQE
jgi:hypothetical protein